MRRTLLVVAALLLPAAADLPAAGMEKTPWVLAMPRVSAAPGWVELKIRIAPDGGYRRLTVEIDSPAFFRSSLIPLNGAESASTYWFRFDRLPAGDYAARVLVERSDRDPARAETTFHVF
jgi:hypothetical protein